jgi:hypothetical protein
MADPLAKDLASLLDIRPPKASRGKVTEPDNIAARSGESDIDGDLVPDVRDEAPEDSRDQRQKHDRPVQEQPTRVSTRDFPLPVLGRHKKEPRPDGSLPSLILPPSPTPKRESDPDEPPRDRATDDPKAESPSSSTVDTVDVEPAWENGFGWTGEPGESLEELVPGAEEPVARASEQPDGLVEEAFEEDPVTEVPADEFIKTGTVAFGPEELPAEEPVAEEPVVEVPVAEVRGVGEPGVEVPVAEEPVVEVPVAEESVADEPATEWLVYEEPVAEEPAVEVPVGEVPVAEEPVVESRLPVEALPEQPVDEAADGPQMCVMIYPAPAGCGPAFNSEGSSS